MKTNNFQTKSSRTRQFIIEKSAALFNKKGIWGTSLSDIMEVTGLTKGSIYGNFKDKDEVAVAVFEYNVSNMLEKLYKNLENIDSAIDKLLAYPAYFREECTRVFENGGCAILNTAVESDDSHPELKVKVVATIKRWENSLIKIIKQGIADKEINEKINPEKYAVLFIGTFEGGVMLSKVTGEMRYLYHSLDHLERLILNELKNK